MSQSKMIEAGIQVEAGRELAELARPLIQKIARGVRRLRTTPNVSDVAQSEVIPQTSTNTMTDPMQG